MYTIKRTKNFEKSFGKFKASGQLKPAVINNLKIAIGGLVRGKKLDPKFKDHPLVDDYRGYRERHIKGDLLLIYEIDKNKMLLTLVDIGSHSYLFG